jgi:hypothetical protein
MNGFKLLIDTNVVIGLEDAQPVQAPLAELVRVSGEHGIGLFVDGANYDDVARDKDETRRAVTLSKLAKFQQLRGIPLPAESALVARFGAIKNDHDRSDVRFLAALDAKAVDFVVSQDIGLHRRGQRAGLGANVFTIEEALQWVKRLFGVKAVNLPSIVQRKAYEIDKSDAIFESLRADYPDFDAWFDKCRKEHRECWVLELDGDIAGLIIRKNETHAQADTEGFGPKILKICTFKVRDEFLGEKYGELLLKQVLWFAAVVFRPIRTARSTSRRNRARCRHTAFVAPYPETPAEFAARLRAWNTGPSCSADNTSTCTSRRSSAARSYQRSACRACINSTPSCAVPVAHWLCGARSSRI